MSNKIVAEPEIQPKIQPMYLFKIILIGDTNTGKTTICNTLSGNNLPNMQYQPTIGVDFNSIMKEVFTDKFIKIHLWDTAGQEKYRSIVNSYYRNTCGMILTYDITDSKTFNNLEKWLNEVKPYNNCKHHYRHPILLLGTKKDKAKRRKVSYELASNFAREHQLYFREINALVKDVALNNGFTEFIQEIFLLSEQERISYIENIPIAKPITTYNTESLIINPSIDTLGEGVKLCEETLNDITSNLCKGIKYVGKDAHIISKINNKLINHEMEETHNSICNKCQ